jgi:hypothetical protein
MKNNIDKSKKRKPRYQTNVYLTEEDNKRLIEVQSKGFSTADIFRAGLQFILKGK